MARPRYGVTDFYSHFTSQSIVMGRLGNNHSER